MAAETPFELLEKINIIMDTRKAIKELRPREQKVLKMRFGIDTPEMTLDEIGVELGVTRERVRQIENDSLRKLKHICIEAGYE